MESGIGDPLAESGRLLEAGDLDGAVRACQRALRLMPDSFPAHLRLAQAYGRKLAATRDPVLTRLLEREFGEAMRLAPADEASHNALFDLAVETGQERVLAARYRGHWASLPFAAAAARRLDEAVRVPAPMPESSRATVRNLMWLAVILVVGGLAWEVGRPALNRSRGSASVPAPGPAAPAFTLEDLSGRKVSLSDFRGKAVVVIDFWATWCGPCRTSLPALHSLRRKYKGKGVEVLNLSLDDDTSVVEPYIRQEQLDLWVLLDRGHETAKAYGVRGIPSLFVVDKEGSIREHIVGYSPNLEDRLDRLVDALR